MFFNGPNMDTCYLYNDNFEKEAKGWNRRKISAVTSSRSMAVNSMKNVTKHIKMKFLISPLKCFLCQVIILELVYRMKKLSTVYYIYEKNRPHSDLWDFKKCAFLFAVECADMSYFNSTSVICFINKTMLDV